MEKEELKKGDIVQLKPEYPNFGGMLVIVDELKAFGIQGYLMHFEDFTATRYKGRAFVHPKFEDFEYCGRVEWIYEDKEVENS